MGKVILVTGATDGIGQLTAEKLVAAGHRVLIHGRNPTKLKAVEAKLNSSATGSVESFCADLSDLNEVEGLAKAIKDRHSHIDVIINNAGVYKTDHPITKHHLDVRFVVNTMAPYLLTKRLLPLMDHDGRVVNVSSAAQAPVDLAALAGQYPLSNQMSAYAQSKLALIMWTRHFAQASGKQGPVYIAVNPGSLLASKMVKEGFGVPGKDLNIGANILVDASLSDTFAAASGQYFDNDLGEFSLPDSAGMDERKCRALVEAMDEILNAKM